MDRLLIKRLVSRAEERAAALDGGATTMGPIIDSVLTEQELTEVTADPAFLAHAHVNAKHVKNKVSYGRDSMLQDDFTNAAFAAVYDEHAGYHDIAEGVEGSEEEEEAGVGDNRRKRTQSYHDLTARHHAAERQYQSQVEADASTLPQHFYRKLPAYPTKQTNKSGVQHHSHPADIALSPSSLRQQAAVADALEQYTHGNPNQAAAIEQQHHRR
jgi:hypothetical protein